MHGRGWVSNGGGIYEHGPGIVVFVLAKHAHSDIFFVLKGIFSIYFRIFLVIFQQQ